MVRIEVRYHSGRGTVLQVPEELLPKDQDRDEALGDLVHDWHHETALAAGRVPEEDSFTWKEV